MYKKEKALVDHYDRHVKYYSPMRIDTVDKILNAFGYNPPKFMRALDLGCGTGWFAQHLKSAYSAIDAIGVDISKERIENAKKERPGPDYICSDIYSFLKKQVGSDKKYDLISLWDVIEHLESPIELLNLAKKCLSPKGDILATVPHNHVYVAHLQVFSDKEDVKKRLQPKQINEWADCGHYYLCRWWV